MRGGADGALGRPPFAGDRGATAIYLVAPVAYVLLKVFGVPLPRSLAWNTATIGIALFSWR
jgi:uncharacterized MAPEG superfamily protein